MTNAHFGMIGLGTMGRNFLLNVAGNGIAGVGYDLDEAKRELLLTEGKGLPVETASELTEFFSKLEKPRNIMLLVPAGPIVDSVIGDLMPQLDAGDLIIDGGNSHFTDTDRREADLSAKSVGFMGVGVSGGEEGARHGASIMPGGTRDFYDRVEATLQAVSAKVNGEPCVAYMGHGSAGHFVKMVHNGIEYGLMQIIAETYDYMHRVLKMSYVQMSETFSKWNGTELNSFLIEITAEVLKKADPETGLSLVEMILDKAGQKGTGKWTSQAAMDLGVPIPTIDSAVAMRQISSQKETRVRLAEKYDTIERGLAHCPSDDSEDRNYLNQLDELKNGLICSFIVTYSQGMSLLGTASTENKYDCNLAEIARIWRGGCIIRSALLEDMRRAFAENPSLRNLMLDNKFAAILAEYSSDWSAVIAKFIENRIPAASLSASLAYFDALRSSRLPANLIQAQRDFFGAHTYQRTDKEGVFHTPDWDE